MKLSVIIPSYKGQALLQDSLPHLCRALDKVSTSEIIVVDNGSKDSTVRFLKHHYPDIRVKQLDTNYGFTKAVNTGIKVAKGEYILLLNNDCHLNKNTLQTLMSFMQKNKDIIATQPVIVGKNGNIENIGYIVDLKKGKATPVVDAKLIPSFDNATMWETGYIYGLSGACLLLRKDSLRKVGTFDERFHSYLEDVDFFIRLAQYGSAYAPCPEVSVIHKHMSTSATMKGYKEWHDLTNWIRIIKKNYPLSYIMRHLFSLVTERLRNVSGWLKCMIQV